MKAQLKDVISFNDFYFADQYREENKMRKLFSLVLALAVLTGCAENKGFFYKQGVTFSTKQKDYDTCKIKSFKEIPQNIVTKFNPGIHNPGTLSCNTIGSYTNCQRVGALDIPASTSSKDANEGMRERFLKECMEKKGYAAVVLPECSLGEEGYNSLQKAPPLNKIKCLDPDSPTLDD